MKKVYLVLLLCASFVLSNAAPAYPGLITVTQEDGSTISFYLHGDEHFSYRTTEDGYLIAENMDGILEYAYFGDDNSFRTSGVQAHNPLSRSVNEQNFVGSLTKTDDLQPRFRALRQQRKSASAAPSRSKFPLKGSPRGLIILVSYQDVPFQTPKANFENLANQHDYSANGGTGSIKDYFTECSHGQFTPDFDVYGPYTLPHERAYYGAMSGSDHDIRAGQMIIDACLAADADVNFADYATGGTVDNVFVYFAGHNQAEGGPDESIWPHRSSMAYYAPPKLDDVNLADYACTSEFRWSSGSSMCGIGTFCHEFSHVLGLPDFYDTDYASGLSAMGSWDIMTQGNYNNNGCTPPTYTAYERFFLGWLTPTALTNDSTVDCEGSYSLQSLISANTAFLVSKTTHNLSGSGPNPKEFFMLEYRKMEGRDTYTGLADGLLITHINYNPTTWNNNGPNNDRTCLGYYPVIPNRQQAYGDRSDLYPYVADNCLFTLHGETEPMLRKVINIVDNGNSCSFDYVSPNEKLALTAHDIDAYMQPVETQFVVTGSNIEENLSVTIADNQNFSWRRHTADDSESYSTIAITISPDENGNVFDSIDVKYQPKKVTYDEYSETKFSVKGTVSSSLTKIAKFRYRNRRPIYVTAPVAYEPKDVTGSSAALSWSFVADTAAGVANIEKYGAKYYLDVYSTSDEPQVETEGFENFPDSMCADWSATFTTSTGTYKKEGARAASFETPLDTLFTKEFASDIEKYSFWVGSAASSTGMFYALAQKYESGVWDTVKRVQITTTTADDVSVSKMKSGYRRMKFYFVPEGGNGKVALDEVSVTTGQSIFYVAKNTYLRDTTYVVQNLERDKEYRFKVRATDKDERSNTPRYENITDPSNEVVFKTTQNQPVPEDEDISITVVRHSDGVVVYEVYISELEEDGDYKLFIYNMNGFLVDKLPVVTNPVTLPQLPVGQYIIKYAKDDDKSKSGPSAKFHYTSNLK